MLKETFFNQAKPIGPKLDSDWPGERKAPLYWVARKTFDLDAAPDSAEILMAVDRHYELFINGQRVARQRGFFSGDEYLYAQRWTDGIAAALRQGENTIEVVIRTDPWRNKNYRCFRPALLLECSIGVGSGEVAGTDGSWQVAVIDGWREMISLAGNRTIHWERIAVPSADQAILCGIPDDLTFSPAQVLDSVPAIYLWNDPPIRTDLHRPKQVIACGDYCLVDTALSFDTSAVLEIEPGDTTMVLQAIFQDPGGTELGLVTSVHFPHRIELNGECLCERSDVPNRHQMSLPTYLIPVGWAATKPGLNTLRITISAGLKSLPHYRLAVYGLPALTEPSTWTDESGNPQAQKVEDLGIAERIGAKLTVVSGHPCPDTGIDLQSGPGGFTTFDLGQLASGRLSLRFRTETPGRVYLAHGFNFQNGAVDCHRINLGMVDVLDLPAGESAYESFDFRTFRYLEILLEGFTGPVEVSDIQVEEPIFVDEDGSSFKTSDSKLDAIWRASKRTTQLCVDELFVDNPEREHAQWMDGIVYASAPGYYFFGERQAVKARKAFEEIALTQQPDGQLAGYAPGQWFPRLPLQCHMALFALGCHRHFMHTGDEDFAQGALEVILRMVAHWEKHRTRDGLIADLHTVFVDWGSNIYSYSRGCEGPTGALTAMNAYYLGALVRSAEMAEYLGRSEVVSELRGIAAELRTGMLKHLYDAKLGLFRDGAGEPLAEKNVSQTANILAVLHGAAPDGEAKAIMTRAFTPNPDLDIIPANSFFALHAGAALFESGCDELALNWLRGFGKMLDEGPGTLWETWEPYASQCQSAGAPVAYLFARYLAGVYPAEPGYRVIGMDPHPADLERLDAVLNTPHGRIGVKWIRTADGLGYELDLPEKLCGRPVREEGIVRLSS